VEGRLFEVMGTAPKPTGGFGSIVVLRPETAVDTTLPAEDAVMDQSGSAFHPKILLVRLGQTVAFRNSEDVLHNVHVVDTATRKTVFNVGTPVVGSYRHTFDAEGAYDVSCEIHPSMAAFVFVTGSPYAAVADSEGRFEISGVPSGHYLASVWNLDPKRRVIRPIEIVAGALDLDLTANGRKAPDRRTYTIQVLRVDPNTPYHCSTPDNLLCSVYGPSPPGHAVALSHLLWAHHLTDERTADEPRALGGRENGPPRNAGVP
jgi:plastocyanin